VAIPPAMSSRTEAASGRWFYGHTGATPGYITFAAGTSDGRRMFVVAVNGVGEDAIGAMGRYLDDVLCRP
jgi:hypothetical protein